MIAFFFTFFTLIMVLAIWWLRKNHREVTNFRYFFAMIFPVFGLFITICLLAITLWHISKRYRKLYDYYHKASGCITNTLWANVLKKYSSVMNMHTLQNNLKWSLIFCIVAFIFGVYFIVRTHYKTRKRDLRYTNLNEEFE